MSELLGLSVPLVVVGFVSSLVLVWLAGHLFRSHATPYPPGPPGLPVLGNALEIPPERSWLKFAEWARDYGDVVHLTALNKHIIVLSSQEAFNELLIKRGANNSNRPVLNMSYMCGWQKAFALLMYGDRLRTTKRITNSVLNQRACQRYIPIQQDTALRLVRKLFRSSDQVDKSLHWFSARILLKIVYDHEVAEDGEDQLVLLNEEGNLQFSAAASPGWVVDIFPSLRYLPEWFPGAGFVRQARSWNKTAFAMYDVPFQMVKAAMAAGTSHHLSHSVTATLLRGENGGVMSEEEEDIIRYATGSMYGAGGETTASALQTFFLAMVLHPEVQRLAQAEIDAVTGGIGSRHTTIVLRFLMSMPWSAKC